MKSNYLERFRRAAACCLLLLFLAVSLPLPTHAESKYMECWEADFLITLDEAGGAEITENWECWFGGDTITRYRRHYSNPDPENYSIEVREILMDGSDMELLDAPDESRPEGSAAVYEEDGDTHVEMYLDALDESHTFTITYYVSNAAVLFEDVAEFHYTLSSENEAFDIDILEADIEIPYGTEENGLSFWAHGPTEGTTFDAEVEDGMVNTFHLHMEDIPADHAVTVRFAMPTELFPNSTRREPEDALERILEEEHSAMDMEDEEYMPMGAEEDFDGTESSFLDDLWYRLNMFRWKVMRIWYGLAILLIVALPVLVLLFGKSVNRFVTRHILPRIYWEKRLKPVQAPEYYPLLPDSMKPALVKKLMSVYPTENGDWSRSRENGGFVATILDLAECGVFSAERNEAGEIAYMVSGQAERETLTEYEQVVFDLFTAAGAAEHPVTTGELTSYMRENYSWCKEQYKAFDQAVDTAFRESGLSVEVPGWSWTGEEQKRAMVYCGVFIFLGAFPNEGLLISAVMGVVFGMTSGYLLGKLRMMLQPTVTLLTQEGEDRYALWSGYSNYLRDFTNAGERKQEDLRVWRKYLVYAVALGCSTLVMEELKLSMPAVYDSFTSDPYLNGYEDIYRSASEIDREGGYTIHSSSSSSDSGWDSWDDGGSDWGGCSDSGGDSDSGSSGSDFD